MKVTAMDIKKALGKRHKNEFFLTECKNGPTGVAAGRLLQFDALAIYKSWANPEIRGYEIKTSRGDFLGDSKYSQYLKYFHTFYFVVPTGLIQRQEVEENIGLIYYNSKTKQLTTRRKAIWRNIEIDSLMLLYIIMNRLDSDRLPYADSKTEYWQDWLDNKKSYWELAYKVKSKLLNENIELKKANEGFRYAAEIKEELEKIYKVMNKYGISTWYLPHERLDEVLASKLNPVDARKINEMKELLIKVFDIIKNMEMREKCEDKANYSR